MWAAWHYASVSCWNSCFVVVGWAALIQRCLNGLDGIDIAGCWSVMGACVGEICMGWQLDWALL